MTNDFPKTCKRCEVTYESALTNFSKQVRGKNGVTSQCGACAKEKSDAYRAANKEKVLASNRNHYNRNKEYILAKHKEYAQTHKEAFAGYSKNYAERNPEKVKESQRKYKQGHKEEKLAYETTYRELNRGKINAISGKSRATVVNSTPAWCDHAYCESLYIEADRLTKLHGVNYHVDHIDPMKSKLVCGLHVPDNLQVVPAKVNRQKFNKFKPYRITQDGLIIPFTEAELRA